jgi:hypothetical protein
MLEVHEEKGRGSVRRNDFVLVPPAIDLFSLYRDWMGR